MLVIQNKQDCCGCSACVQRCPKQCIVLHEDEEGFLYPNVDMTMCIDCGLCEKVCPVINQHAVRPPLEVYAAKNPNCEIRMQSSSGGIFTQLAELVINDGGVVFGVKWNEHFEAIHAYTETIDGLADFRSSKYLQSKIGFTYRQAEAFLKDGRKVLFSGTPCQIAGLKCYLRKEYNNLLSVDIFCHGCPSPGVFRWYMSEQIANIFNKKISSISDISSVPDIDVVAQKHNIEISNIDFRDKSTGWKTYSFRIDYKELGTNKVQKYTCLSRYNPFMRGFLRDLYLRPSCHSCPSKSGKSGADITIGDYWGIQNTMPELDDDQGVSAILANTPKGCNVLHAITAELHLASYEDVCRKNPALVESCRIQTNRTKFFHYSKKSFHKCIEFALHTSLYVKILMKIKRYAYFFH